MSWLAAERSELGVERILDAAARLFVDQGIGRPGMEDIAREAGCSRATVYRHFDNKQALLHAFVLREARDITEQVTRELAQAGGGRPDVAEAVVATLAAVRARPYLEPWYTGAAADLLGVLRESPAITELAGSLLGASGQEPDRDLGHWVLRVIMSFLREPAENPEQEHRLVRRFLAPVVASR